MPYEYTVADADGLIHVTAWGEADLVEIVALLRQMEADVRVRPGMPALVDARNQQFRLAPLSLRQLADLHAESRAGARRPVAETSRIMPRSRREISSSVAALRSWASAISRSVQTTS